MMLLYLLTELLGPTIFYDFAVSFDDEAFKLFVQIIIIPSSSTSTFVVSPVFINVVSLSVSLPNCSYSKCLLNHSIFPLSSRRYVGPIIAHIPRRPIIMYSYTILVALFGAKLDDIFSLNMTLGKLHFPEDIIMLLSLLGNTRMMLS